MAQQLFVRRLTRSERATIRKLRKLTPGADVIIAREGWAK